jgi:hypothetical protein
MRQAALLVLFVATLSLACGEAAAPPFRLYERPDIRFLYPRDWGLDDSGWLQPQSGYQMIWVGADRELVSIAWFSTLTDEPVETIEPQLAALARDLLGEASGAPMAISEGEVVERHLIGAQRRGLRREYRSQGPGEGGGWELTVFKLDAQGRTAIVLTITSDDHAEAARPHFDEVLDSLRLG